MRLIWLWLGLTIAFVTAAPWTALAADTPAPDPAPAPAPQPDPAVAQPAAPPSAQPPAAPPATSEPAVSSVADPVVESPPPAEPSTAAAPAPQPKAERPKAERPRRRGRPAREPRIAPADLADALPARLARTLEFDASGDGALSRAAIALLLLVVAGAASLRLTLRLAGPGAVVALALALAVAPPAAQADTTPVWAECSPGPGTCGGWFRGPVNVKWQHPFATGFEGGTCVWQTIQTETAGKTLQCNAWQGLPTDGISRAAAVIRVDATAPTLTGAVPDRPPDNAGWFNHPVGFSFQASDATSGVAACDAVPYAGPEGEGVLVAGACRDVAGNVRSGSFPLNYDTTPPAPPEVEATPGNRLVDVEWALDGSAVSVEVARVAPGADEVVYTGAEREFVDRGLRNGVRHRYRVTAIDRAGNRAASDDAAVPTDSPLLTPAGNAHLTAPPLLDWKPRRGASYYNVQLFRGRRKILSRWPSRTELRLRHTWRFAGKRRRLVPGRYVWYVWPGFGKRAERDYGRLLGRRSFLITR